MLVHNHVYMGEIKMENEREIIEAVLEAAKEVDGKNRLNCAQAFELAGKLGTAIGQIGRICNENNVRISNCQLGCFK